MKKWMTPAALITAFAALPVMAQDYEEALEESWSILDSYCMECHSFDEFRGGLALEGMGPQDVNANPGVFEEVLRKLKIHAMPPRSQPQPDLDDRNKFMAALEATLDAAAFADPYAGTTTIHRLNREEYTNAIRDLLEWILTCQNCCPVMQGAMVSTILPNCCVPPPCCWTAT